MRRLLTASLGSEDMADRPRGALTERDPLDKYAKATARGFAECPQAGPLLLFALRLWVPVCLALCWLEPDNVYWAGTSAAIVCQRSSGPCCARAGTE